MTSCILPITAIHFSTCRAGIQESYLCSVGGFLGEPPCAAAGTSSCEMRMQGVAEAESRRAADAAEQAYRKAFDRSVPADEGALQAEHVRALAAGQAVFSEAAVGGLPLACVGLKHLTSRVKLPSGTLESGHCRWCSLPGLRGQTASDHGL